MDYCAQQLETDVTHIAHGGDIAIYFTLDKAYELTDNFAIAFLENMM